MKWTKSSIDSKTVREISARYGVDLLKAAILVRRNLVGGDVLRFVFEDDLRFLHNPFLLDEMGDAVDRIQMALSEGEKVHVYGDRDVDGVTSVVLMTETLQELGIETSWGVPMGDAAYGLTTDVIDTCVANDVTLLVAVDCGTTNTHEISYAADRGIDTIVIDHHNPQDDRPPAVAIVNPKLPDSSYPFDGLCACALVAKVREAVRFSQTDLYGQPVCLLNARPGNESLVLDAIKLENLVEVDRISENIVPGIVDVEHSRLGDFLLGVQILVYDAPSQERALKQAFGANVEIHTIDVAPELWKIFPSLHGKSLMRLRSKSRDAKYGTGEPSEIDVFRNLFETFVYRKEAALTEDLRASLDLVAIATLADMMPMTNENRILVKNGLDQLSNAPRKGLRELLERQKLLGKKIDARDIGWNISPVINAAGRMGEPDKAVQLLLLSDEAERASATDELIALNKQRRKIGDDGWELVQDRARASHEENDGRLVFVSSDSIHRGITGIIAGRLARQFESPAAVVTILGERAVGSVRSARGLVATELLSQCDELLTDWGGHDAAAGFHLPVGGLATLEAKLRDLIRLIPLESEAEQEIQVDAELTPDLMQPDLRDLVAYFAPYGQGNPPLCFLVRGLRIAEATIIGKKQDHLRLLVDTGGRGARWPAVFWGAAERVARKEFSPGDTVDAVFHVGTNFYQGNETPQLTILDLHTSNGT